MIKDLAYYLFLGEKVLKAECFEDKRYSDYTCLIGYLESSP
jgi:hypothetical protein